MHVVATTMQFMAQEKEEEWLGMEDTKILYKFLVEDWDRVLLVGQGKQKMDNLCGGPFWFLFPMLCR